MEVGPRVVHREKGEEWLGWRFFGFVFVFLYRFCGKEIG